MNTLFSTFARKVASIVSVLALLCAATLSFTSVVVLGQASPPTAVITVETGAPYSVNDTVFLNGYASTTSTGAAYNNAGNLTFAWQLTRPAGSTSLLAPTASSDRVSFVADVAGTFTAQLVVTDTTTTLTSAVVQQSFTVNPVGGAGSPTAVITMVTGAPYVQNTAITANALSSLDSTNTVGGAISGYAWNLTRPAGSTAALNNPAAATVTFNPDVVGTYTLGLVVAQGATLSAPVTQNINVVAAAGGGGGVPTAVITMVTSAPYVQSTLITANALSSRDSANTVGGLISGYAWSLTRPAGSASALNNPAAATVSFTPDLLGTYTLALVVSEGATTSLSVTQNINVVAGGGVGSPVAVITVTTAAPYVQNTPIAANGLSSRDSVGTVGGLLTGYAWSLTRPAGSFAAVAPTAASTSITFNPDVVGTYVLSLVVAEGVTLSAPVSQTFVVAAAGGGGGGVVVPGVPYGAQGGGKCENPAYCNIPWNATDHLAIRHKEGVSGITLEKKVQGKRSDTAEGAYSLGKVSTADVAYEIVIGNLTGYNIESISIKDVFKSGQDVKLSNIRSVSGASYDPTTRIFTVNTTIQQGQTYSFSYNATLTAKVADATANNMAVVESVVFPAGVYEKSKDARDGLSDSAYVAFGSGSGMMSFGTSLVNTYIPTEITADKTEVIAGDEITYTITVRNNTDDLLTGVVVSDNYDETLIAVSNAGNGDDTGTDISFAIGTIEPGAMVALSYTATVREDAAYADTLLSNNTLVYSDQYTDQATASLDVHVAPRFAGFLAGAHRTLPQTGIAIVLPALLGSLGVAFATRKKKSN